MNIRLSVVTLSLIFNCIDMQTSRQREECSNRSNDAVKILNSVFHAMILNADQTSPNMNQTLTSANIVDNVTERAKKLNKPLTRHVTTYLSARTNHYLKQPSLRARK
ncbi:hypothetical protein KBB68_01620 [Candidatus Babeliales bacterium]|nr:hypothetical protein [Candidatus Babeliales bacterium]